MKQAELERLIIDRGYRIKYRRPDDFPETCVWTYQLERDGWTGGFRIAESVLEQEPRIAALFDYIERSIVPIPHRRQNAPAAEPGTSAF